MQSVIRMPTKIFEKLNKHVDGVRYRSRNQLISIILMEWLKSHEKKKKRGKK